MVGLRLGVVLCASVALLGLCRSSDPTGAEPRRNARESSPTAAALKTPRLDQFDKYYALSVKPDPAALPHKADAHDIVVVFGTSAGQNGEFRARGMATLRAFLDKLNPADRVCRWVRSLGNRSPLLWRRLATRWMPRSSSSVGACRWARPMCR